MERPTFSYRYVYLPHAAIFLFYCVLTATADAQRFTASEGAFELLKIADIVLRAASPCYFLITLFLCIRAAACQRPGETGRLRRAMVEAALAILAVSLLFFLLFGGGQRYNYLNRSIELIFIYIILYVLSFIISWRRSKGL